VRTAVEADVSLLVDSGEDRKQGVLPVMGKPIMAFAIFGMTYRGTSTWLRNFFDDALAHVGAALHQCGAGIDHHALREQRHGQPVFTSSGVA